MTGPDHELVTEIHILLDNIDKISAWLNRAESFWLKKSMMNLKNESVNRLAMNLPTWSSGC